MPNSPKQPEKDLSKGERLQVVLARAGMASRRGVVTMIEEGRVTVNGTVVKEKGARVFADRDEIIADGQILSQNTGEKRYFILNKPKNVMTTLQDPHAEHTIAEFFEDIPERLFPVGRLDRDTTGLILMTNDGELAFRLMHPSFGVEKRYRARIKGVISEENIAKLERGVRLEEGMTAPCRIKLEDASDRESILTVTLHEGKKRQIRRIFEMVNHRVLELERQSYGPITLGEMRRGERRELSKSEVTALKKVAGLLK